MHTAFGLLAIVAVVGVATAISDRYRLSAPLLLVVLGLIGSFLPFAPDVTLEPDLVLDGILPPLLYAAAIRTSLLDFRTNRRPIALLSVGYVVFSTVGTGFLTHLIFPSVQLAACFAFGAVVSPPDAVAATAVARRVGMPRGIVALLEGESLVNDASALVLLGTATAVLGGGRAGFLDIGWNFVRSAGGGVIIGFVVAFLINQVRRHSSDVILNTTMSLATPFVAFLPAQSLHTSGVLAVVVAGLLIGHKAPGMPSGASRVAEKTNWATVQFLLENSVFLLIGLQVRRIVQEADKDSLGPGTVWLGVVLVLLVVFVLRPIWVFPGTYVPRWLSKRIRQAESRPPLTYPAVISWAGMRGVVTLAAAFALPKTVPHQPVLVLAALVVVGGTLLLQGLTLPALVRRLGLRGPDPREEALERAAILQAATDAGLQELDRIKTDEDVAEVLAMIRRRTQERGLAAWERLGRPESEDETPSHRYMQLRLGMLAAERAKVLKMRDAGKAPHEVLTAVLESLDVEESMLDISALDEEQEERETDLITPSSLIRRGGCEHLQEAPDDAVPNSDICEDCVREGTTTVHLRMCLACGNVACCDSSTGRHAERHHHRAGHPVMRSFEPGEAWRWCYVDELLG